jgi:hypothetical protein
MYVIALVGITYVFDMAMSETVMKKICEDAVEKTIFAFLSQRLGDGTAGPDAMANQPPTAKEVRLKNRLLRQLGFWERSAGAYDQGLKGEGIRMAAVMRLLFCNSKKSGGLVFQLHGKKIFRIRPVQVRCKVFAILWPCELCFQTR